MRAAYYFALFILCLSLFACSTPEQSKARQEFGALVDDLCSWTGMTRSGPIRDIERWRTDNPGYNVAVRLNVEGSQRPYIIRFDSHRRLLSFTPEPFDLSNMSQGLGYNSVKALTERSRCIAAVNEFSRHSRWTWYGLPTIQRVGSDFVVTYVTVFPTKQKKHTYLDPYVSFLVTPKGTLFAAFFGS